MERAMDHEAVVERTAFRPKVFVTQYDHKLRFEDAEHFGEVVFLTQKEYRPAPCPASANDIVVHDLVKGMSEYVPGRDYIVVTGSAIPNLIVGSILSKFNDATHRILKWNNRTKGYELFHVGT
jgi:hypothetical protein